MVDESCIIELSLSFFFTVRLPFRHLLIAFTLHSLTSVSPDPGGLPSCASTRGDSKRHLISFWHKRMITIKLPEHLLSKWHFRSHKHLLTISSIPRHSCLSFLLEAVVRGIQWQPFHFLLKQPVYLSVTQMDPKICWRRRRSEDHNSSTRHSRM